MLERFVARVDLDCVLLAGRYSLLDRSGAELLAQCAARGVGVILGGVFNTRRAHRSRRAPDLRLRGRAAYGDRAALDACRRRAAARGIALGAAALQFAMRHPAVTTVLVGARSAAEVDLDVGFAATPIDDDLFAEVL